jgi:TolB-like protein
MRVSIVNLHADEVGNPQLPRKFQAQKKHRARMRLAAVTAALLALAAIVAGIAMFSRDRVRSTLSAPEKSIAVLPFENRSEDKTNAYFADGIQDEILTRLAKIADLKVISRTSTEKYRNRPGNLKTVAEELGVVALLEGSVQKAGGKVRVVVQLIAAKSDHHLWAETYDRSLDDIFAVQSEIAGAVASALRANLTPQESVALKSAPTNNQTAYDLFLRAEYFFRIAHANFTVANLPEAMELYRQAVADDPQFALAYARLSFAESYLRWRGAAPKNGLADQSRPNAEKALALQPDLMEAHLALAYCDYYGRLDYAHALEHLSRAQALAPNSAEVLFALGAVYRRQLRFEEAIAVFERAAQYDPGNQNLFFNLGATYWWAGRNDKVQPNLERALALNPVNEGAARFFARFLIEQRDDVEGARKVLRGHGPGLQTDLAGTYLLTRDYETALRLIEELPADSSAFLEEPKDEVLGLFLHWAGHDQRARPLLEPARDRQIALLADKTISPRQVIFSSIYLAQIELGLGHRDAAIHIAERGAQSDAVTRDPIQGASYRGYLAGIYAEAGRNDQAIALISELLKSSQGFSGITPHTLRLDPTWDPLRNDPRFQKLAASSAPKDSK